MDATVPAGVGHNGGPPLEEYTPPDWRFGGTRRYFHWKSAHDRAWKKPRDVALFRLEKAERAGVTYEEYTLELLERGRYLQPEDTEAVARIKRRRKGRMANSE